MEWTDEGFVLSARPHGEGSLILSVLTENHGRHVGIVKGGASRKNRGIYQPGNRLSVRWRARLAEHLGSYRCEPVRAYGVDMMADPLALAGLSALCALCEATLPERESHRPVFLGFQALMEAGVVDGWAGLYVKWELGLLAELGYGLDLTSCAATGRNDHLSFVSPKSGRAVSQSAGEPYKSVLLPLPPFLLAQRDPGFGEQIAQGLTLTGFFLEKHIFAPRSKHLPDARSRFVERVKQINTISGR